MTKPSSRKKPSGIAISGPHPTRRKAEGAKRRIERRFPGTKGSLKLFEVKKVGPFRGHHVIKVPKRR